MRCEVLLNFSECYGRKISEEVYQVDDKKNNHNEKLSKEGMVEIASGHILYFYSFFTYIRILHTKHNNL